MTLVTPENGKTFLVQKQDGSRPDSEEVRKISGMLSSSVNLRSQIQEQGTRVLVSTEIRRTDHIGLLTGFFVGFGLKLISPIAALSSQ